MSRVVIAGVTFSPNLGDGVIADTLQYAIRKRLPDIHIELVDLAGRTSVPHGETGGRLRALLLSALRKTPLSVKQLLIPVALSVIVKIRYEPAWLAKLAHADVVLIGGGQLFSDVDYNFPVKISRFAAAARKLKKPYSFIACGVGSDWSQLGGKLFLQALRGAKSVSVRDAESMNNLQRYMGSSSSPSDYVLVTDSGVMAAETYGAPLVDQQGVVGFGVIHPTVLRAYSEHYRSRSDAQIVADYVGLITGLIEKFGQVELFCNGAQEDDMFMRQELGPRLGKEVSLAKRPLSTTELCHGIAKYRGVVAFRLHALIVAWSYGIPIVGLSWDRKLGGFFSRVGLTDQLQPDEYRIPDVLAAMERGLSEPKGRDLSEAIKAEFLGELDLALKRAGL